MYSQKEIIKDDDPLTFFTKCKLSFKFFAERVCDKDIQPFHLEWIKAVEENNRVAIEAPTGFGKTTLLGILYPLWRIWNNKNQQFLIVSNTLPQSTKILTEIRHYIEDNAILAKLIPKHSESWTKTELFTSNNCRFYCRPYSINLKGFHVNYILADEASSFIDHKIYFDYLVTRATAKKGKVVAISTPEHIADLMERLRVNSEYWFKRYTAIVDGKSLWPTQFSLERLEKIRREIGDAAFKREYMCDPSAPSENAIFLPSDIEQCFAYSKKFEMRSSGGAVFIGCDFAIASGPRADYDAYIVLERLGEYATILHGEIHKGMPIAGKVMRLEQLNEIYKPTRIIVDESSIGKAIVEALREKGIPVEGADFSSKNRANMLINLKKLIDDKKLIIPRNADDALTMTFTNRLIGELVKFAEVRSEKTRVLSYQSTGAHDDTVMALALACKGITSQKKYVDFIAIG